MSVLGVLAASLCLAIVFLTIYQVTLHIEHTPLFVILGFCLYCNPKPNDDDCQPIHRNIHLEVLTELYLDYDKGLGRVGNSVVCYIR